MTAAVLERAERRERLAGLARRGGASIVLVAVLVIGTGAFGGSFASARNFSNIALDSSYLVLIGIGMTVVIISGGIDLSVGSVFALAGVLAAYGARWGSLAAVALPLLVGFVERERVGPLAVREQLLRLQLEQGLPEAARACVEMRAYMDRVFAERRAAPRHDLISRLIAAREVDDRLSDD